MNYNLHRRRGARKQGCCGCCWTSRQVCWWFLVWTLFAYITGSMPPCIVVAAETAASSVTTNTMEEQQTEQQYTQSRNEVEFQKGDFDGAHESDEKNESTSPMTKPSGPNIRRQLMMMKKKASSSKRYYRSMKNKSSPMSSRMSSRDRHGHFPMRWVPNNNYNKGGNMYHHSSYTKGKGYQQNYNKGKGIMRFPSKGTNQNNNKVVPDSAGSNDQSSEEGDEVIPNNAVDDTYYSNDHHDDGYKDDDYDFDEQAVTTNAPSAAPSVEKTLAPSDVRFVQNEATSTPTTPPVASTGTPSSIAPTRSPLSAVSSMKTEPTHAPTASIPLPDPNGDGTLGPSSTTSTPRCSSGGRNNQPCTNAPTRESHSTPTSTPASNSPTNTLLDPNGNISTTLAPSVATGILGPADPTTNPPSTVLSGTAVPMETQPTVSPTSTLMDPGTESTASAPTTTATSTDETEMPTSDNQPTLAGSNNQTNSPSNIPTLQPTRREPLHDATPVPLSSSSLAPTSSVTTHQQPSTNPQPATEQPTQTSAFVEGVIPNGGDTASPSSSSSDNSSSTTATPHCPTANTEQPSLAPTEGNSVLSTMTTDTPTIDSLSIDPDNIGTSAPPDIGTLINHNTLAPTSADEIFNPHDGQDTRVPTMVPSNDSASVSPSVGPSDVPSTSPSKYPTGAPSVYPTERPSTEPTETPSFDPSSHPTDVPTLSPTDRPTGYPTKRPSTEPTETSSADPSSHPTNVPTLSPTDRPTGSPTKRPSTEPTETSSVVPSSHPTNVPTVSPAAPPTALPSAQPSEAHIYQTTTPSKPLVIPNNGTPVPSEVHGLPFQSNTVSPHCAPGSPTISSASPTSSDGILQNGEGVSPTGSPSNEPSKSFMPSNEPSEIPSFSLSPSELPSTKPTTALVPSSPLEETTAPTVSDVAPDSGTAVPTESHGQPTRTTSTPHCPPNSIDPTSESPTDNKDDFQGSNNGQTNVPTTGAPNSPSQEPVSENSVQPTLDHLSGQVTSSPSSIVAHATPSMFPTIQPKSITSSPSKSSVILSDVPTAEGTMVFSQKPSDTHQFFPDDATAIPSQLLSPDLAPSPRPSTPTQSPTSFPSQPPVSNQSSSGNPTSLLNPGVTGRPSQFPSTWPSIHYKETPTATPSSVATPTALPRSDPTSSTTSAPIINPSSTPILGPTNTPLDFPSMGPSLNPSPTLSGIPTVINTQTELPCSEPTVPPAMPSRMPTLGPTHTQLAFPSSEQSLHPSRTPSARPTAFTAPTDLPWSGPTITTVTKSNAPTFGPTTTPTEFPSRRQPLHPSRTPSGIPTVVAAPTDLPISGATTSPVAQSNWPTLGLQHRPSDFPSKQPLNPSGMPSEMPTSFTAPTGLPISNPTVSPVTQSSVPTLRPTNAPSDLPSSVPSVLPSGSSSAPPTAFDAPTDLPISGEIISPVAQSIVPILGPTNTPFDFPSPVPSVLPIGTSSARPTAFDASTELPESGPTISPVARSSVPILGPTKAPSDFPASLLSVPPSGMASEMPTTFNIPSDLPISGATISPVTQSNGPMFGLQNSPSAFPSAQPLNPSGMESAMPTSFSASSNVPISGPTSSPVTQSSEPTLRPTNAPSELSSRGLSRTPSAVPTEFSAPLSNPTISPVRGPNMPTVEPTSASSGLSLTDLSKSPSAVPTAFTAPTGIPLPNSTISPVKQLNMPTLGPTDAPSELSSTGLSKAPSAVPTALNPPTNLLLSDPTMSPATTWNVPTNGPSGLSAGALSKRPSFHPSETSVSVSSNSPFLNPTLSPTPLSNLPTSRPANVLSQNPSIGPSSSNDGGSPSAESYSSELPSDVPLSNPTSSPKTPSSSDLSNFPTVAPTQGLAGIPWIVPPSSDPSWSPSESPFLSTETPLFPALKTVSPTSRIPSSLPTLEVAARPTQLPSLGPSLLSSETQSALPTLLTTANPSELSWRTSPSSIPTQTPLMDSNGVPISRPPSLPSFSPTIFPADRGTSTTTPTDAGEPPSLTSAPTYTSAVTKPSPDPPAGSNKESSFPTSLQNSGMPTPGDPTTSPTFVKHSTAPVGHNTAVPTVSSLMVTTLPSTSKVVDDNPTAFPTSVALPMHSGVPIHATHSPMTATPTVIHTGVTSISPILSPTRAPRVNESFIPTANPSVSDETSSNPQGSNSHLPSTPTGTSGDVSMTYLPTAHDGRIVSNSHLPTSTPTRLDQPSRVTLSPSLFHTIDETSINPTFSSSGALSDHPAGSPSTMVPSVLQSYHETQVPTKVSNVEPSQIPTQSGFLENTQTNIPTLSPSRGPPDILWIDRGQRILGDHEYAATGSSVAYNSAGDVMAIGMPGQMYNLTHQPGVVRVFKYETELQNWTTYGSDIYGAGGFGLSVALSADGYTLAVGSPVAHGRRGLAAVFRFNGTFWETFGGSIVHGSSTGDNCGYSVDISSDGSVVAVGCPGLLRDRPGHVVVYKYSDVWSMRGATNFGPRIGSLMGFSVGLSGDGSMLVVGAPGVETPGGQDAGQIFTYINAYDFAWQPLEGAMQGFARNDLCGYSVDISDNGHELVYGCPGSTVGFNLFAGRVFVAKWSLASEQWAISSTEIHGSNTRYLTGRSVSMSSNGKRIAYSGAVPTRTEAAVPGVFILTHNQEQNDWEIYGSFIRAGEQGDRLTMSLNGNGGSVAIGVVGNSVPHGCVLSYEAYDMGSNYQYYYVPDYAK